jgi:hypothetical protein
MMDTERFSETLENESTTTQCHNLRREIRLATKRIMHIRDSGRAGTPQSGLDDCGLESQQSFTIHHHVQFGSVSHLAFLSKDTG